MHRFRLDDQCGHLECTGVYELRKRGCVKTPPRAAKPRRFFNETFIVNYRTGHGGSKAPNKRIVVAPYARSQQIKHGGLRRTSLEVVESLGLALRVPGSMNGGRGGVKPSIDGNCACEH